MFLKRIPLKQRLFEKTKLNGSTGCIEWTGGVNASGYGTINEGGRNGRSQLCHRAAWTLSNGEIPQGLCVLHACDNPRCVNVDHLFIGTVIDNNADRDKKGRCKGGGMPGVKSGHAKLNDEQVYKIRSDARSSYVIGKEYGLSGSAIRLIKAGKTWKHLLATGRASA